MEDIKELQDLVVRSCYSRNYKIKKVIYGINDVLYKEEVIIIQGHKIVLSEKQISEILKNYTEDKMSMLKISNLLEIQPSVVRRILVENGVEIDSSKRKKNNYIIDGNIAKVELRRRNKESLWTIIDLEDLERVINYPYSWHVSLYKNSCWYAVTGAHKPHEDIKHLRKTIYLNYFILFNGETSDLFADHINHDTLDNRKCNLRAIRNIDNSKSRKGKNKNNKSGYRNVCWLKTKEQWCVQLQINGKNTQLGYFDDIEEAAKFAEEMRQKYYGEFAGEG